MAKAGAPLVLLRALCPRRSLPLAVEGRLQ